MEQYDDFIGKRINMFLDSHPRPIRVEIIKINPETRRGTKFQAVYRRDALGKIGFIQEGDQWVISDLDICRN